MMIQASTHFWSAWKNGAKKSRTSRTTRALIRLDTWWKKGTQHVVSSNHLHEEEDWTSRLTMARQ